MSIKLLLLDVDGTMTDGKITYTNRGDEIKSFCVQDGLAIVSWIKLGGHVAIVTGRESQIVAKRAQELKISYLYQGVKNKQKAVEEILEKLSITWDNVAAIGDDLNDLPMLLKAKKSYVPANANEYVKQKVDTILRASGGNGAVREMIEDLLQMSGRIGDFRAIWEVE